MNAFPEEAIYKGHVHHTRHLRDGKTHRLRSRVFGLFLQLEKLEYWSNALRLFSHNRFNLTGFYDKDHGPRDGSSLRAWVEAAAAAKGHDVTGDKIYILAFPRYLGYVFNPLSIFFIYGPQGLRAVLYEVKNTFGDQHGYYIDLSDSAPNTDGGTFRHQRDKGFYVSPFIHMDCTYQFRIAPPGTRLNIAIHQFDKFSTEKILTAAWTGTRFPLNDFNLARMCLIHPFLTHKIIGAIHWEALKIWLKGGRYHKRPAPPENETS